MGTKKALREITFDDIKTVVILVQFEDGSAHQVLSSDENKKLMLRMLSTADNGLKLDKELAPITFETKE